MSWRSWRHPQICFGKHTQFITSNLGRTVVLGPGVSEENVGWVLSHEINHWAFWHGLCKRECARFLASCDKWLPEEWAANWGLDIVGEWNE